MKTVYTYDPLGRLDAVTVTERFDTPLATPEVTDYVYELIGNLDQRDVATGEALHRLHAALLAGEESRRGKPRSPYAVKTPMGAMLAALNGAHLQGWLPLVPRIRRVKTANPFAMENSP